MYLDQKSIDRGVKVICEYDEKPILKSRCCSCERETNHTVEAHAHERSEDDHVWFQGVYQIVKCGGCERYSFRSQTLFSEDIYENEDGTFDGYVVKNYPESPLIEAKVLGLPDQLNTIYEEIIAALNVGALTLCAAGSRALLEGFCADQGVNSGEVIDSNGHSSKKRNLEGMINGLWEKKLINDHQQAAMHGLRFLGNEAVHELEKPTQREIELAIKIVEQLAETIYGVVAMVDETKRLRNRRRARCDHR